MLKAEEAIASVAELAGQMVTVEGIAVYQHGDRICLVSRDLEAALNSVASRVDYSRSLLLRMPGLGRRLSGLGYVVMGGIGRINWLEVTGRLAISEVTPFPGMLTDIVGCNILHYPKGAAEPHTVSVDLSTVGQLSRWEQAEVESPNLTDQERSKWREEFRQRNQAW